MFLVKVNNLLFNKKYSAVGVILFFTLVSVLGVNQYRYGWGDQSITIPFLKAFLNPGLYPGDFLLSQVPYYYTFLWFGLGAVIKFFGISIPILFFIVYFLSIFFTFAAVYLLAMLLFKKKEVAYLSMFFALFAGTTFAGASVIDDSLLTKTVVLPVLLFSLYLFLKQKYYACFILQGVGFLVHPLSAVYTVVMIAAATLAMIKKIGWKKLILYFGLFILMASPILVWKAFFSPESGRFLYADANWIELLRLRSPHHIFPFLWGPEIYLKSVLIAFLFAVGLKYKPSASHGKVIFAFAAAIAAMSVLGTIFSEIKPLSIVLTVQPLRSFEFFAIFALIYFANYLFNEIESRQRAGDVALAAMGSLAFFYGNSERNVALFLLFSFFVFVAIFYTIAYLRNFRNNVWQISCRTYITAIILLAIFLGSSAYAVQPKFTINNAQNEDWLAVQDWAKQNTQRNDMFIVPPEKDGFRVESERPVYADWKDGTLMNFNPSFAFEWMRRMEKLGYVAGESFDDNYNKLNETAIKKFVKDERQSLGAGNLYLVREAIAKQLSFPVAFKNEGYVVYKVER